MLSPAQLHSLFLESTGVSIDTRSLISGQIFFALRGDRFDGHDYVDQALMNGAEYCVVDRAEFRNREKCLYYPNVLAALQRLSRFHRDTFDITVFGITGSNGKTTTKELLHSVISNEYETLATEGNFNNHLGVPLTLLRLNDSHEFAIVEMGANHVGEIKWLCQIARPTHGLVTNIGKAHLEGFGSIENIRMAKSELYQYLEGTGGMIFHNGMESSLDFVPKHFPSMHTFGDDQIAFSEESLFQCFQMPGHQKVVTKMYGSFNRNNMLAAIVVGSFFDIPFAKISNSISSYRPSNNRSQLLKVEGNTFYLDAYNANPSSMMQALEFFRKVKQPSKVIIIGDMLELGEDAIDEHRKILSVVEGMPDIEEVLVVGEIFIQATKDSGDSKVISFKDVAEAKVHFSQKKYLDRHILVKGSRGIQLEKLILKSPL